MRQSIASRSDRAMLGTVDTQGSGPMDMQELVDIAKRNLLFLLLLATLLVLNI